MKSEELLLDNPAWSALTTAQAGFATGTPEAKRYRPGLLPFTACAGGGNGSMHELDTFIDKGEVFFIIGDLPVLPAGWSIDLELPCAQMLLQTMPAPVHGTAASTVVQMEALAADEMFDLINTVQPGYYLRNTHLLGNYFGIRENGKLVAMAGERMRMAGYSELSAICTLPGYTGRGYAQQLMMRLCSEHAASGIISFLHVALTNQRAIRLYEHMGFRQRRTIVFRRIKKQ